MRRQVLVWEGRELAAGERRPIPLNRELGDPEPPRLSVVHRRRPRRGRYQERKSAWSVGIGTAPAASSFMPLTCPCQLQVSVPRTDQERPGPQDSFKGGKSPAEVRLASPPARLLADDMLVS
jgi:hypothetical protein